MVARSFSSSCLPFGKLQVSQENLALVKTIGPLTDADVIKLRQCEKKQVCLSRLT